MPDGLETWATKRYGLPLLKLCPASIDEGVPVVAYETDVVEEKAADKFRGDHDGVQPECQMQA